MSDVPVDGFGGGVVENRFYSGVQWVAENAKCVVRSGMVEGESVPVINSGFTDLCKGVVNEAEAVGEGIALDVVWVDGAQGEALVVYCGADGLSGCGWFSGVQLNGTTVVAAVCRVGAGGAVGGGLPLCIGPGTVGVPVAEWH